jgi:hypothetical protein
MIKSKRMRWVGHVVCTGENRCEYKFLVGELERRPPGRPRHGRGNNI